MAEAIDEMTQATGPETEEAAPLVEVKELEEYKVAQGAFQAGQQAGQAVKPITDPASLQEVVEIIGSVAHARKEVERLRKEVKQPYLDAEREIDEGFGELRRPLEGMEASLKKEIEDYNAKIQRQAQEEQERQDRLAKERQQREDARAEKEERPPVQHEAPPVPEPPKTMRAESGASVTMHVTWVFEVTDAAAVPDEFKLVNESAIRKAVDAGARSIPGVEITKKETPRVRGPRS